VLTAAQVNTYLMEQSVMVFADAAARTTALTGVVAEGMLSYLKDTNAVEVYDGANWVASDDPNAIQNTIVDAKGDLISATGSDVPARLAVGADYGFLQALASAGSTGLQWNSGAWTSYSPTISTQSGTLTTASASGKYIRIGKLCVVQVEASITTNGTGAGTLYVTKPFNGNTNSTALWREILSVGNSGQVYCPDAANFAFSNFDNSYAGANSRYFVTTISFEVA